MCTYQGQNHRICWVERILTLHTTFQRVTFLLQIKKEILLLLTLLVLPPAVVPAFGLHLVKPSGPSLLQPHHGP